MDGAGAHELSGPARLRDAGLRATRPRSLVLGFLTAHAGHHTVDDIAAGLRAQGDPLPRMTVYNVTGDLVRAGLVLMADVGPGAAVYEAGSEWHHHFVCRRCGAVHDVPCAVGAKPCLEAGAGLGTIDEAQVIFRGVCTACLAQASAGGQ